MIPKFKGHNHKKRRLQGTQSFKDTAVELPTVLVLATVG